MKADIYPPIDKRPTEQLLEIIETKEQWRAEVIRLTQEELIKRGVSLEAQDLRRKSKNKFQSKIASIKSRATYTPTEKILIVLFGPVLAIIFQDIFMFQAGDGFRRKNRQGLLYLILGIILWGFGFYVAYGKV